MNVRVAFLKRDDRTGEVLGDGFELHGGFPIILLPRIGETVVLPEAMLEKLQSIMPDLRIVRRLEVVSIDYFWNTVGEDTCIYLAEMEKAHRARLGTLP